MKKHYDVLIVTPGNNLEALYVSSLVKTLIECNNKGLTYYWLNGRSSLVHHARELSVGGDMILNPDDIGPMHDSVTYNKMIWIDSDIVWEPEDFFKLYEAEDEIVSGVYLLTDGTTSSVHDKNGEISGFMIKQNKEKFQVQSIGFGFVAIKSGVFERLPRPWFMHFSQVIKNSRGEELVDSLGEDISFCVKAHNANIPIYCDPSVTVGHVKANVVGFRNGQIRQFQ
jgi:hypothetical protein